MIDERIIFGSDSAVIDSRYRTRAEASLKLGRDIVSHDPFFSREAASEGSMTVSVVQAAGVMGIRLRASRLRRDRLRIFSARLILVGPGRPRPAGSLCSDVFQNGASRGRRPTLFARLNAENLPLPCSLFSPCLCGFVRGPDC